MKRVKVRPTSETLLNKVVGHKGFTSRQSSVFFNYALMKLRLAEGLRQLRISRV